QSVISFSYLCGIWQRDGEGGAVAQLAFIAQLATHYFYIFFNDVEPQTRSLYVGDVLRSEERRKQVRFVFVRYTDAFVAHFQGNNPFLDGCRKPDRTILS